MDHDGCDISLVQSFFLYGELPITLAYFVVLNNIQYTHSEYIHTKWDMTEHWCGVMGKYREQL